MSTILWTAADAARALGAEERTLQRRAARAYAADDPAVQRIARAWVASEAWWRGCIAIPARRGRQPRLSNPVERFPGDRP